MAKKGKFNFMSYLQKKAQEKAKAKGKGGK
jgi:hypothetical protein